MACGSFTLPCRGPGCRERTRTTNGPRNDENLMLYRRGSVHRAEGMVVLPLRRVKGQLCDDSLQVNKFQHFVLSTDELT